MGASSECIEATRPSWSDHGHATWCWRLGLSDAGSTGGTRDVGSASFASGRPAFSGLGPIGSSGRAGGIACSLLGRTFRSRADVGLALHACFASRRRCSDVGIRGGVCARCAGIECARPSRASSRMGRATRARADVGFTASGRARACGRALGTIVESTRGCWVGRTCSGSS